VNNKTSPRQTYLPKDRKLYYEVTGEGEPVVLTHGFAEDHQVWKYQVEQLSKHYRIITPDLPGSGNSDVDADASIESMAETIRWVLDAEEIDKATIMGHSMGGYIALAFAEKYADKLNALALVHSSAYPDSEEKKTARRRGIEFIQTHGSYAFLKQSAPNLFSPETRNNKPEMVNALIEQYRDFNPTALITYYEAMMQRPGRIDVLTSLKTPVLFMIGRYDNAVPFVQSMEQSKLPQISYIHVFEHSAHMGLWEEVSKTNSALASFLADVYV